MHGEETMETSARLKAFLYNCCQKEDTGPGERAQWLRTPTGLPDDLCRSCVLQLSVTPVSADSIPSLGTVDTGHMVHRFECMQNTSTHGINIKLNLFTEFNSSSIGSSPLFFSKIFQSSQHNFHIDDSLPGGISFICE